MPNDNEGGRIVALTEEDFRKSGFRSRELVAVLAGPSRLIAGRICSLPSAALRPGGVGLSSASAQSLLGCDTEDAAGAGGEGARVRVRRLSDTSATIVTASSLDLVLEAGVGLPGGRSGGGGGPAAQQGSLSTTSSPRVYLERLAAGRMALLQRAAGYCAYGTHAREGDVLSVSFEGIPHLFRVATLEPPIPSRQHTAAVATAAAKVKASEADDVTGDSLVAPLAALSVSEPRVAESTPGKPATVAPPPPPVAAPADHGQDGTATGVPAAITDSANGSSAEPRREDSATAVARVRLEAFYREHNPDKLVDGDIDGILEKYAGREETLFAKLEKKYGAGSSLLRTTTAGGNTGTERQQQQQQMQSVTMPGTPAGSGSFSIVSGQQSSPANVLGRRIAGGPHPPGTPSALRQRFENRDGSGGRGGNEPTGIRSWGAGETLWFVASDTSIRLSAADARSPEGDDGGKRLQTTTDPSGTKRALGGGECSQQRRAGGGTPRDGDWGSVGGLSSQIQQLREAIELPLMSPDILRKYGVRPPRGVLLHGPPGTGKTTLARAAAKACGCHVIVVNGSELMSRWVGAIALLTRKTQKVDVRMEDFMPLDLRIFWYTWVDDLELGVAPYVPTIFLLLYCLSSLRCRCSAILSVHPTSTCRSPPFHSFLHGNE